MNGTPRARRDWREVTALTPLRAALLLFGLVLALYGPLTRAGYLNYDDPVFVEKNRRLDSGITLENLRWAFSANLFYYSPTLEYWSPLTALSRLVDVELYGKDPAGAHLSSVLLHGLSTVLLFLAMQRLTGDLWRSLLIALLWAVHPVVVEPVAWLSARKDVLYGVFWNLTLLAYANYSRGRNRRRYLLLLGAFALAAMSKPMVLTLPCVLLLLDMWPLRRLDFSAGWGAALRKRLPPLLWEKAPLFAISAVLAWASVYSQRQWDAIPPEDFLPLGQRVANALTAYWEYLRLVFWPVGLSPFHPFTSMPSWAGGALAAAGLLAVSGVALWQLRARPWVAVGWLWFCGVLFPVSGLVQIGSSRVAERYLYMALPGLLLVLVWAVTELVLARRRWSLAVRLTLGMVVLLLCGVTWQRVLVWQNASEVWASALARYPRSALLWSQNGNALWDEGAPDRAESAYLETLKLTPLHPPALAGLARIAAQRGDLPRAAALYQGALHGAPGMHIPRLEYARVLHQQGDLEPALAQVKMVQGAFPYFPEAWLHQAQLERALGDQASAQKSIERFWEVNALSQ